MNQKDFTRLDELAKMLAQRAHLEKKKKALLEALTTMTQEDLRLSAQLSKETNDYELMEKMSLKRLFAMLSKDFEAKKDKEYQEMKIAAFKREALREELEDTRSEVETVCIALEKMSFIKDEYDKLLASKLQWATQVSGEALKKYESEIFLLKRRLKETVEAIDALSVLMLSLKSAEEGLSSAQGWGLYDILGGGIISSLVKHDHIDRASSYLKDASHKAAALTRELMDIDVSLDIDRIEIDGFSKTFDIFFDNIFSDLTIQDEINKAFKGVVAHIEKGDLLSKKLEALREETETALDAVLAERNTFVCNL